MVRASEVNTLIVYNMAVYNTEEVFHYIVAAKDYEAAEKIALTQHKNSEEEEGTIDHDLSFEVTCAAGESGTLYHIYIQPAGK